MLYYHVVVYLEVFQITNHYNIVISLYCTNGKMVDACTKFLNKDIIVFDE